MMLIRRDWNDPPAPPAPGTDPGAAGAPPACGLTVVLRWYEPLEPPPNGEVPPPAPPTPLRWPGLPMPLMVPPPVDWPMATVEPPPWPPTLFNALAMSPASAYLILTTSLV